MIESKGSGVVPWYKVRIGKVRDIVQTNKQSIGEVKQGQPEANYCRSIDQRILLNTIGMECAIVEYKQGTKSRKKGKERI